MGDLYAGYLGIGDVAGELELGQLATAIRATTKAARGFGGNPAYFISYLGLVRGVFDDDHA